jgi:hypothetical protein
VLSTSPALAQQILSLAAGAPAKDRMALPPSGASGGSKAPLTAWARYPCAPLAAQLRSALAAAAVLAEHAFDPISTKSFGDLGATVCQVIDGVTMTTVAEGGVASTTLDVPAAAALYKK